MNSRAFCTFGLAASILAASTWTVGSLNAAEKGPNPEAVKPSAAEPAATSLNTLSDAEKAAGWKLLFDGRSTDQLRTYNGDKISSVWQVQDGALTMTGKGGGDLITKEEFESYELTVDYKISVGGNSGLLFNVVELPGKKPYVSGPEIQIQDNVAGHDPQKAGWLYQMYQPPIDAKSGQPMDATHPAGQWNTLKFTMDHGHGTVWMNGQKYYDFVYGSPDWQERLAKTKFAKWPEFATASKGHICLQDHASVVAFRNIKIRPIADK